MSHLLYRPCAQRGALDIDECVIVPANPSGDQALGSDQRPAGAWLLMFYVRTADGYAQYFRTPVNPNGPAVENGPLGRTWGLNRCGANEWQVSPSIDYGNWHQTPKIVEVPDGEPWQGKP